MRLRDEQLESCKVATFHSGHEEIQDLEILSNLGAGVLITSAAMLFREAAFFRAVMPGVQSQVVETRHKC